MERPESIPSTSARKSPKQMLFLLQADLNLIAQKLTQQETEKVLSNIQSLLLQFLREVLVYLKQDEDDYDIDKALRATLPKFPTLFTADSVQAERGPEYYEKISEFLLQLYLAATPQEANEVDVGIEEGPVDKSVLRTAELLRETIASSFKVVSDTAQKESLLNNAPKGLRATPPPKARVQEEAAFVHKVIAAKAERPPAGFKGFNNRSGKDMFRFLSLGVKDALVGISDALKSISPQFVFGILGVLLTGLIVFGAYTFYMRLPKAEEKIIEKVKWSLVPELVLPGDGVSITGPVTILHGFGQRDKTVEVVVDDILAGQSQIDTEWVWQMTLPTPLNEGDHTIKVRYKVVATPGVEQAPVTSERKITVIE